MRKSGVEEWLVQAVMALYSGVRTMVGHEEVRCGGMACTSGDGHSERPGKGLAPATERKKIVRRTRQKTKLHPHISPCWNGPPLVHQIIHRHHIGRKSFEHKFCIEMISFTNHQSHPAHQSHPV